MIISRNPVFLFSVLLILISGCNTKRESLGSDNEIIVVASIEDQEDIRNVLKKIFSDTLYTPEPEPFYKIKFVSPKGFNNLKRQTNLAVASIGDNLLNPGTNLVKNLLGKDNYERTIDGGEHFIFTEDQFAKGQLFMILSGQSKDDIIQDIRGKEEWVRSRFNENFNRKQKKYLFDQMRRKDVEEDFMKKYQWSINIPWGWEIIQEKPDSNWVWLGREMPYQWVSVHWEEGLTAPDSLIAAEVGWNFPQKYYGHIRYHPYEFNIQQTSFLHWAGWRITGIWESEQEAQGGPFISYIIFDGVTDRTYHINLLIFYPGNDKSIYLRQLDLIAHSFHVREEQL